MSTTPVIPDPDTLTDDQRDGQACLFCGAYDGPQVPVGRIDGCQVFAHEECLG